MDSYKWLYNIIILTLYFLVLDTIQKLSGELSNDTASVLNAMERILFSRIDNSIRFHIRKQGISIVNNIYSGFDTEFNTMDIGKNSLI
jgi:hypothetical protein